MFTKNCEIRTKKVLDGVIFKNIAHGGKTHLTEFRLSKGCRIPMHSHPHEQTGYLVSGKMTFVIGDETFHAEQGDGWNIAGNVEHGVTVIEESLVIEVFSPAREDYLHESK